MFASKDLLSYLAFFSFHHSMCGIIPSVFMMCKNILKVAKNVLLVIKSGEGKMRRKQKGYKFLKVKKGAVRFIRTTKCL